MTKALEGVPEKPRTWQEYMQTEAWPRFHDCMQRLQGELEATEHKPAILTALLEELKVLPERVFEGLSVEGYDIWARFAGRLAVHELDNALGGLRSGLGGLVANNKADTSGLLAALRSSHLMTQEGFLSFVEAEVVKEGDKTMRAAFEEILRKTITESEKNGLELIQDEEPINAGVTGENKLLKGTIHEQGVVVFAIRELVKNALYWVNQKYLHGGVNGFSPTITVDVRRDREIEWRTHDRLAAVTDIPPSTGAFIRITVTDNDPGVAEKDRERIFEAYSGRQDGRDKGGVGLGMLREFARKLGGDLVLEDKEDNTKGGATFILTIPYQPITKPNA